MSRPEEITSAFLAEVDRHLAALINGTSDEMLEINAFAELLHIHPVHLSNTIKSVISLSMQLRPA